MKRAKCAITYILRRNSTVKCHVATDILGTSDRVSCIKQSKLDVGGIYARQAVQAHQDHEHENTLPILVIHFTHPPDYSSLPSPRYCVSDHLTNNVQLRWTRSHQEAAVPHREIFIADQ